MANTGLQVQDKVTQLFKIKAAVIKAAEIDKTLLAAVIVHLGEVATDKGERILFDGDALAENVPVFTVVDSQPDPVPVPDGTYTLETGEVIEVMSGVCVKITPAAAAEPPVAPGATAQTTTPAAPTNPKQTIERHEIESYFKEAIKPLNAEIETLKTENTKLKEANTKLEQDVVKMGEQASALPAATTLELSETKQKTLSLTDSLALIRKNAYK